MCFAYMLVFGLQNHFQKETHMRIRNLFFALTLCFVPAFAGCSKKAEVIEEAVQSPAEDAAYEEEMENEEVVGDQ